MKPDFLYTIKTVRRSRHLRISVHHDGNVVVTKPYFATRQVAEDFLQAKLDWVREAIKRFQEMPSAISKPHSRADYLARKQAAHVLVLQRLEYFNSSYGFAYKRISIRDQRTRWGSCSRTGHLNFSYRLLDVSPAAADYIIVHELCHLKEFNHSPRFWALVAKAIPNYMELRRELRGKAIY